MANDFRNSNQFSRRHFIINGTFSAGSLFFFAQQPAFYNAVAQSKKSVGEKTGRSLAKALPFTRKDVSFSSVGAELSGWLYQPDVKQPWPLVVMAHGYSATRNMTADKYAEVFCSHGMAVLLYDHRGFGESGGEPRRQINPWIQAKEYIDAISFAKTFSEVDPERIAIWGDSLSGGVALVVAAMDSRVAALVVQVPALGAALPPADPEGSLFEDFRNTVYSANVEPVSAGEVDGPMPVVSDDPIRRPCALTPLTAYRWFIEYGGRLGSHWMNDVTRARPKTPVAWHPGICAPHVACPSLFLVSPVDEMPGAVPAVARDAFDKIQGPKKWLEIEGGHFGLLYHSSSEFDIASSAQVQFLSHHLAGKKRD